MSEESELDILRKEIERTTIEIMRLSGRRLLLARDIARVKMRQGLPLENLEVERRLREVVSKRCEAFGLDSSFALKLLNLQIEEAKRVQNETRNVERMRHGANSYENGSALKIAVLGAGGRMGKWLTNYFAGQGHILTVSDVGKSDVEALAAAVGATVAENNLNAVKGAELVVVSVTLGKTAEVLQEIAPQLRKNTIVAEISSIKSNVPDVLSRMAEHGIQPLSLHPLFGPGIGMLKKRMALIPVLDSEHEKKIAERIFPDAEIIVVDAEGHDRVMAVTLSIPYFMNLALASVLTKEDIDLLRHLGGSTFTLQLTLLGGMMTQNGELQASMHMVNEHALGYLNRYLLDAEKIRKIIERKDVDAFCRFYSDVQETLSRNLDLMGMYEDMYAALGAVKKAGSSS